MINFEELSPLRGRCNVFDLQTSNPIGFNIWDDFHDDGYIPEGNVQKTRGYVEENLTYKIKSEICKVVYDYILSLDMTGVTVNYRGDDIEFVNLTHKRLDQLVIELKNSKCTYGGVKIQFYSES